jgi:hypothetical protein
MAGLPHWNNSQAATNYYEPIFKNQFEVIITPPSAITDNVELLVEQVKTISGLPELFTKGATTQDYKFAKRAFADGVPNTTLTTLTIKFEVNLNDENNMYVYNTLRGWGDLIYDPLNGRQGLKKDYVGEIAVFIFNKAGDIFREFKFKPAFLAEPLNAMDLDYMATGTSGIYTLDAKFICDTYTETRVGQINI